MSEQPLPLAGWYADPYGAPQQRYWDGRTWSDQTAPAADAVPPPSGSTVPAPWGYGHGAPTGPGGWANHQAPAAGLSDYYARAFAGFDAGGSRNVWNWAAFLLGGFWYLFRGMWVKALLYFAAAIFSGGFLAIPLWIYGGMRGTYDLYLLRTRGNQLW